MTPGTSITDDHLNPGPASADSRQRALNGVRVLDFSRFVAGPYATMLLADAGAEVIKVEPLGGEETRDLDPMIETPTGPSSGYFYRFNRSKKSICIDTRNPMGRAVIERLIAHIDVVVENFRPGVMDKLGLGYEDLRRIKPELIYCSISGYGHTESPHRGDPAFAILAEVSAAVVGRSGGLDAPPTRVSVPLGDLYPAALAVGGISMALFRRDRTGVGAHVDLAMYDSLVSLNENAVTMTALTGREMMPTDRPSYTAPFGIFRTLDGFICIAVLGEKIWRRFCTAIEREDLALDDRVSNGTKRSEAMDGILGQALDEWLSVRTREEAVLRLGEFGVPAGPVTTPREVLNSPQTAARQLLWDVGSFTGASGRVVGSPIRIGRDGFAPPGPVPGPGQHTADVLLGLGGWSEEELASLCDSGVVEVWSDPNFA